MILEPEIIFFEGDRFINFPYIQTVKLKKDYDGVFLVSNGYGQIIILNFLSLVYDKLRLEWKSSEGLTIDL